MIVDVVLKIKFADTYHLWKWKKLQYIIHTIYVLSPQE